MKLVQFFLIAFLFSVFIPDIYSFLEIKSIKHDSRDREFSQALNIIKSGDESEYLDQLVWTLKAYEYDENYEKRFWYAYMLSLKYLDGQKNDKISEILSCQQNEAECDIGARMFRLAEEICHNSTVNCDKVAPYWYSQAKALDYQY